MSGSRPSHTKASRQRRSAILDAARSLISERGIDKLLIADVAERASVSVATIYNLVGTRERLLIALLDDVADRARETLGRRPPSVGIEGCVDVITTTCEVVLAEADTVRTVLASVGAVAPDQWLAEGMEGTIRARVDAAIDSGHLSEALSPEGITAAVQLGFRGALISWVFGLLGDDELVSRAELMALHVLVNAAARSQHTDATKRLHELDARKATT